MVTARINYRFPLGVVLPSSGGTDLISYLEQTLSLGIVRGLFVPALAERAESNGDGCRNTAENDSAHFWRAHGSPCPICTRGRSQSRQDNSYFRSFAWLAVETKPHPPKLLFGHRVLNAVPDSILQGYKRRWRKYFGWLCSLEAINDEIRNVDFTVSIIAIPFSIAAQ
jgi:hypothetical protein